jgi:CDP-diacylglycerol--glycerol-3-phosphate 3-phosphatidyltransferase
MKGSLNLPNAITVFRIFLVPVLVVVILTKFEGRQALGIGIFLLAALSDWLDGWIARRRKQVTPLGKLLDPMADKLLIAGAFISLVEERVAPAWMVVVIIGREFAVTGLRAIAAERGVAIAASFWGKAKMGVQVACVIGLLLSTPLADAVDPIDHAISVGAQVLLWVTVAVTVVSGFDYFRTFRRLLEDEPRAAALGEDRRSAGAGQARVHAAGPP